MFKPYVVCPRCAYPVVAYQTGSHEIVFSEQIRQLRAPDKRHEDRIVIRYLCPTNFCPYCGYGFRKHHRTCHTCEYTDWEEVFLFGCPYCKAREETEKIEEIRRRGFKNALLIVVFRKKYTPNPFLFFLQF